MRLNVVETGDPRAGATPAALLHGLFGAAQNWGAIARALAAEGRRVLALDLRNHGASPHADAMDYAALAEDVEETLGAAAALPAVVVGHSMGGKVAMTLALSRPEAVARLAVADIAPVRYPPALRGYVEAMRGLPLHPGLKRREADAALAAGGVPEANIRAFLLQNLRFDPGAAPAWRLALDSIAAAMPTIEDFPTPPPGTRYAGPTLFLCGERSCYVEADHRPPALALFPAARFVTIAGAGHWVHSESPAGFLAALQPFLEES